MWGNSYVDKAYWKGVARMTEKEHQENLVSLLKDWKSKRNYYGELADTLISIYEKQLRKSIREHGNLI
jgi:hypothetical protein